MKRKYLLLILILPLVACSTSGTIDINNSDLVGAWNWTNTDGGIDFQIHETPESTGRTIQLVLNKNYTFSVIENGKEISTGTYQLIQKKSIYSGELERFIQFPISQHYSGIVTTGIIKITEMDTLEISDNNYDGISSAFDKIDEKIILHN